MHETEGVVIRVEGDIAYIRAQRQSSCGGCSGNTSCGTASLASLFGNPLYRTHNPIGAKAGDRVVIGVPEDALFRGALALYAPPLLLLLAGAIGGQAMAPTPDAGEGYSIIGAALGVAASFFWARFHSARMVASGRYQPVILNKVLEGVAVNFYEGVNMKC